MISKERQMELLDQSNELADQIATCCDDHSFSEVIGALTFVLAYALESVSREKAGEVLRYIEQFIYATRDRKQ